MTPPKDEEPAEQGIPPELGSRLRSAREARGLGVADVARQLRLEPRVIEALERDEQAALPAITFVKGYVRSYARLVGLDEAPLLAALPASTETPSQQLRRAPPLRARTPGALPLGAIFRAALMVGGIALVLVLGYPVATRLMSGNGAADSEPDNGGALSLPPVESVSSGESGAVEHLAPPVVPVDEPEEIAAAPMPEPMELEPIVPIVPEAEPGPVMEPVAEEPEIVEPLEPTVSLVLVFEQDSWVEVSDRNGRLLFGLMKQGRSRALEGLPPFRLLLGNAAGVRVEYDGAPFDQSPYRRGKVARFTLGE